MEQLQEAIHLNEIIQKKKKKELYTKPNLFYGYGFVVFENDNIIHFESKKVHKISKKTMYFANYAEIDSIYYSTLFLKKNGIKKPSLKCK